MQFEPLTNGLRFRKLATLKSFLKFWLIQGMMEFYIQNKGLILEKEWKKEIETLKTADGKELAGVLEKAVINRIPRERFGIFFSGGVDSSYITAVCKKHNADFACYTVGIRGGADIESAKEVAEFLNVDLKIIELNLKDVEQLAREVVRITKKNDVVTVGVGIVVLACIKNSRERVFFSGLGSEEIFAGYERHEKAGDINEECWKGLMQMMERDLKRDVSIAAANAVKILTPFLDKDVIASAMKINAGEKIKEGIKKFALRKIAETHLKNFAWRKKKAAQYGSGIIKAIEKLAKQKGFKYKKDYLISLL